jgi:hypothetical protein
VTVFKVRLRTGMNLKTALGVDLHVWLFRDCDSAGIYGDA